MGGPIIIPKNPRSVIRERVSKVPMDFIIPEHQCKFNELMTAEKWTQGDNEFMQSHLPLHLRVENWSDES